MPLMTGDVVITGTPSGVGLGQKRPLFLKAGDTVNLGGTGVVEQTQKVVQYEDPLGAAWARGRISIRTIGQSNSRKEKI